MANKNNGGSFVPSDDYTVTGAWTFTGSVTQSGTTTTSNTAIALTNLTNQVATGQGSNITTTTYPASSGAVTVTMPSTTTTLVGAAGAYRIARGVTALDGSNPTPVATGLTTVVAATVTLEGSAAPGVGTSVLTIASTDYATGALAVYAWKPTSNANPTLIASTGTENFEWVAIGT